MKYDCDKTLSEPSYFFTAIINYFGDFPGDIIISYSKLSTFKELGFRVRPRPRKQFEKFVFFNLFFYFLIRN